MDWSWSAFFVGVIITVPIVVLVQGFRHDR